MKKRRQYHTHFAFLLQADGPWAQGYKGVYYQGIIIPNDQDQGHQEQGYKED